LTTPAAEMTADTMDPVRMRDAVADGQWTPAARAWIERAARCSRDHDVLFDAALGLDRVGRTRACVAALGRAERLLNADECLTLNARAAKLKSAVDYFIKRRLPRLPAAAATLEPWERELWTAATMGVRIPRSQRRLHDAIKAFDKKPDALSNAPAVGFVGNGSRDAGP